MDNKKKLLSEEMNKKDIGFNTRSIHAGNQASNPYGALNPPIFMTSTFAFESLEESEAIFSGQKEGFVYTRGNNPTLKILERKMADLEYGEDAIAFSSGMAAISSVILSLVKTGDEIISSKTIYGSAFGLMNRLLPRLGIKTNFIDLSVVEDIEKLINKNTKVIYFETPSNPSLGLVDIEKVVRIAKKHDIKVVVDNTFATPYFQNPLRLGADVVIHSATKYISGHGDVIAGIAISGDKEYCDYLRYEYMCDLGGVMSPFNGWLLLRGLKTLGVRMQMHQKNAMEIAKFLKTHPKVKRVIYPGLEDFPQHELAKKQMRGFGGIVSFEINGDFKMASSLMNKFELCSLAVSLGDAETLVEHPASMTHRDYPRENLHEFGFSDILIRISSGLEDARDIISDIDNALSKI